MHIFATLLFAAALFTSVGATTAQTLPSTGVYSVYFETGSARLSPSARKMLDSLTDAWAVAAPKTVAITGHASEPGGARINDSLSRRRANAVADYLGRRAPGLTRIITSKTGAGITSAVSYAAAQRVDISTSTATAAVSTVVLTPSQVVLAARLDSIRSGGTLALRDVLFYGGSDELLPTSYPQLEDLLGIMQSRPTMRIRLEGHICCGLPENTRMTERQLAPFREDEQTLSEKRARAARKFLVDGGIAPERISVIGYGHTRPKIYPERTETDRSLNRRVEIRVLAR